MDIPGSFGDWLKVRRKALDLTQEELSQRAGCSIFALRKIESGERRPSKQLAGLLAAALEIPEKDKTTFVRVARGDLNLARLQAPALSSQLTPVSESKYVRHHLPVPCIPLLGRDPELAALGKTFHEPHCRLLTLTGMGGIGKTRLAIEFALRQQNMFAGGIHYVPLASLSSSDSIVPAIAEVLEFSFSGPTDPKQQLFIYLANEFKTSTLFVLDNLEHLLAQSSDAAQVVAEIVEQFPNIKILCTSRERLNLHGEWTYELHGLPIPPLEFVEKWEDYSSAVLFIQSTRRIDTGFELTELDKSAVGRICKLVEGVPLAIELAAAWVSTLTCPEIAQEIESNIDFLTTSMRDIPERHRSLKATFDHSWRLLSIQERAALSRLSVFQGGFDRAAAEKVAGATLSLLASLVSKSLVRRTADTGRYDLHEVIRQYAVTHLADESPCLETREHHSEYYLDLASRYERKLKSASQQAAMHELTVDMDNLRSAWSFGIKHQKFETVGKAVRSFGWFFEVSGLIREGIDQLELLIQRLRGEPRETGRDKVLGASLVQQGLLNFRIGQFLRAQELYKESIEILRSIGDQVVLADALIFNGTIMHLNGNYLEARNMIEEGLAYARAANDPWFSAYGIYNLGHVDSLIGDYQSGYEQMQEGIRMWRELGDPHSISLGLNFLVDTQIKLEMYEEAKASMLESIALCEHTKNRWGMGTAYRYLGLTTMANGQFEEAQDHFYKSLEVFGEYFEGWDIARTRTYLGDVLIKLGDLKGAKANYLEALNLAICVQAVPIALDALIGVAQLDAIAGKQERAFELIDFVLRHPSSAGETKDRANQLLHDVEPMLAPEYVQHMQAIATNTSLHSIVNRLVLE